MKPIYQTCMEKGIQHVATHAVETITSTSSVQSNSPPTSNGKLKHSWEYANARQQNNQHSTIGGGITTSTVTANIVSPHQPSSIAHNAVVVNKKRRKSKKSVPKIK